MTGRIEVKTADLIGPALDWFVAKVEGVAVVIDPNSPNCRQMVEDAEAINGWYCFSPSTDWSQAGPLIEKNKIGFGPVRDWWVAHPNRPNEPTDWLRADQPLVAICRAIVADKLGLVVSVPKELMP